MNCQQLQVPSLEKKAIELALKADWQLAADINLQILSLQPNYIPALNRLANAFHQLNQISQALETYQKVLEQDPENAIACKKIKQLKQVTHGNNHNSITKQCVPTSQFIKQTGRSKVVQLINLGPQPTLAELSSGYPVNLLTRGKLISVMDDQQRHVGKIPGDISFRLIQFIKMGYQYRACIKSIEDTQVQILVQEEYRPTHSQASFT